MDGRASLDPTRGFDPADVAEAERATVLTLPEVVPHLASPDSGAPLSLDSAGALRHDDEVFPVVDGSPVLFPRRIREYLSSVGTQMPADPLEQYVYFHLIRQSSGKQNVETSDGWYWRHAYRTRVLLGDWTGLVLDIGCDDPSVARSVFPPAVHYVGLDPGHQTAGPFRLVGMAEFLPVRPGSLDGVSFLGSLDHILDYHTAIGRALRALKPGGRLILSSLTWSHDAVLYTDGFHFHHFRLGQLLSCLEHFDVDDVVQLPWKDEEHRTETFILARKHQQLVPDTDRSP